MMDKEHLVKSSQEQVTAGWIHYLNQIRVDKLINELRQQQENFDTAVTTINETWGNIQQLMETNRGGDTGIHGFIAEIAQVGLGNAKEQIFGKEGPYQWVNNNGPSDLMKNGTPIQMKFVQSDGKLSLNAVQGHLGQYPDFISKQNGKYQVPKDFYESIKTIWETPESVANKWSRNDSPFTLSNWKYIHSAFSSPDFKFTDIEPSDLAYKDVQKDTIKETISTFKEWVKNEDNKLDQELVKKHQPTVQEGIKITAAAAALEGTTTAAFAIINKRKEGKKLKDLSEEDWKDIAGESALGFAKGGIRGISVYLLSNYTLTPESVSSSLVTVAFGIAEQAHKLRSGEINELEFVDNSEMLAIETACGALFACIGQTVIPIPILGTVIGNAVGSILYKTAKEGLSSRERELIVQYQADQKILDEELQQQYETYLTELKEGFERFLEIMPRAFSPDIQQAFEGSVDLAKEFGVSTEEILDSKEKINTFFMD